MRLLWILNYNQTIIMLGGILYHIFGLVSITAPELHFLGCIMANPQPDKFTKISNELLDALAKIRIAGEARQMLDVIIRKTYGFNKKIDTIPTSQFIKFTNLSRMAIHKAREKLLKMNLITITKKVTVKF